MAKDERKEIAWVSFCSGIRLSSQSSSGQLALASGGSTRLFMDEIRGVPHVIVDDMSLPSPACIPWSNVASVGWLK